MRASLGAGKPFPTEEERVGGEQVLGGAESKLRQEQWGFFLRGAGTNLMMPLLPGKFNTRTMDARYCGYRIRLGVRGDRQVSVIESCLCDTTVGIVPVPPVRRLDGPSRFLHWVRMRN